MLLAHSAEGSADDVRFSFVRSFVVNTARAHYYRVPPHRKVTPSNDGAVVWELSSRAVPSVPYQTASRAGLPVKSVAVTPC